MGNGAGNKPVDVLFIGHLLYLKLMLMKIRVLSMLNVWYSDMKIKFMDLDKFRSSSDTELYNSIKLPKVVLKNGNSLKVLWELKRPGRKL